MSATTGTGVGSVSASGYLGPPTGDGSQILLRIRIAEYPDGVRVSTTIPVYAHHLFFCQVTCLTINSVAGLYLQEVLELVCRKRNQMDSKDYALLLDDQSLPIPLDQTVASLQGKRELLLVNRSMLPQYGEDIVG